MKIEKTVALFHASGKIYYGKLLVTDANGNTDIQLDFEGKLLVKSAQYPFLALSELRKELENLGLIIGVRGAQINVYPGNISIFGTKAYITEMGKQAKELVEIFDDLIDTKLIATIEQQNHYRENWFKSIGWN